jgi:hypothetical protein
MKTRKHVAGAVASICIAALSSLAIPGTTYAADGCKFLLCIAGPWRSISDCVPTVQQVFRDMARGGGFPTCSMSGSENVASNNWNSEQSCPQMYRRYSRFGYMGCKYPGQITVKMNGQPWSTVFWDYNGNTSTMWADQAIQSFTSQTNALPLDATGTL